MTNREALLWRLNTHSTARLAEEIYGMIDQHDSTCALCPAWRYCETSWHEARKRGVDLNRRCADVIADWLSAEVERPRRKTRRPTND